MIIAVIISVAGTLGDLLESMLKRSLGLKDSGTIIARPRRLPRQV
ncbi:MAG: phosphatidate cytidylyltransferase [Marinilabiliales bacterium]|nr:phosphatidate cytidylyltransferase [Marinilabiliales bacterium]